MSVLIKNGFVIDPGRVFSKQNVFIENQTITAVTDELPDADTVIDASGKYVCPGFVDMHMHEDPINEQNMDLDICITEMMLKMGVTTAIGGNCGINVYDPVRYLDIVDKNKAPVNIGLLAGHSLFREKAGAADKYAPINEDQLARLAGAMKDALNGGCLGISYGVRYVPGITDRELAATAECCKSSGKVIAAHIRDDAAYVFDAAKELINVGLMYDLPVQISHIGSMAGFSQMPRFLSMIDRYRAGGLRVTCDCYPYYAFSTRIGEATYDDGFLERYGTDYSAIEICEGTYKGQRCTKEIFSELRENAPDTITVCHVMRQEDVDMALTHPLVYVASDGLINQGQGHPRAAGTFPRYLKQYVKTGKVDIYHAIEKMTLLPAQAMDLDSKGSLNVGADADVTVFDLETMEDYATFENPSLSPTGIDTVIIGGEVALAQGKIVNNRLGKSVRK